VTNNSRQVSACSHHGRRRQTLEAFLITFITQPRATAAQDTPRSRKAHPTPAPKGHQLARCRLPWCARPRREVSRRRGASVTAGSG
jgi:hypothetical protein